MRLEKLSSTLALVAYEFEKINNEKLIKPFPTNRPQAFSIPGVSDLTAEINASTEVLIFVHLNPDVSVDKSINLPANVEPIHFHSRTGSIRVARVPLASLGALSDLTSVRHLSASMRLRAASDFSDIETKLNNFIDEREDLKQSGVVIGLINSEISSALTTFSGNIQSVWDQTEAGTGWEEKNYGTVIPRENVDALVVGVDQNPGITNVAASFGAKFNTPTPNQVVIVKTDFQSARIADAIQYIFKVAQAPEINKPAVIILGLEGHLHAIEGTDDLSRFIDVEQKENFVVPPIGVNANNGDVKTVRIRSNRHATEAVRHFFIPLELNFEVNMPPEGSSKLKQFLLRGWYKANGRCEVKIKSPDGLSTSSQPKRGRQETPNTTQFTIYNASKAFLTVPAVSTASDDACEFLIDVRALDETTPILAGTWDLVIENHGTEPLEVNLVMWVPEGERELNLSVRANQESNMA